MADFCTFRWFGSFSMVLAHEARAIKHPLWELLECSPEDLPPKQGIGAQRELKQRKQNKSNTPNTVCKLVVAHFAFAALNGGNECLPFFRTTGRRGI